MLGEQGLKTGNIFEENVKIDRLLQKSVIDVLSKPTEPAARNRLHARVYAEQHSLQ